MNLHLVLRHKKNPIQKFKNEWLDYDRPSTIETTKEIGRLCNELNAKGEMIFIHRCGFEKLKPSVICKAKVIEVSKIKTKTVVKFASHKLMNVSPDFAPPRGTNFYWA
jgi:hypothetical protein